MADFKELVLLLTSFGAFALIFYVATKALYNVFFHPLARYPGPWYRAVSRVPYTVTIFQGVATHRVQTLHEKYGPVVRIAPDTLSYTCSQAWADIYGLKQSARRGNLPKDPKFYFELPGKASSISTASDEKHRRFRRIQSPAFSEKALNLQEPYIKYHIEKFVTRVKEQSLEHDGVVDFTEWVNYLVTDIIGDLAFGESFGGLDSGKLHPWLTSLFKKLKMFTLMKEIRQLSRFLVKFAKACIPRTSWIRDGKGALSFGAEATKRRMALNTDRRDLMSYILRHNGIDGVRMSQAEIEIAAVFFIIAGSETTATLISGALYLLLSNPVVLQKLQAGIRHDFATTEDITGVRLQQQEYLNAVLKESLRLYPPTPDMLLRWTGTEAAIVAGQVVPPQTSLTINVLAAHRSSANFHRANEFLPHRWLRSAPAEFDRDDKAAFKPFSVGPRDCIGQNLGWIEMRMILAYVLWNFDLVRVEPTSQDWIERQKIFFLWEKLPLNIRIAPREI